MSYRFGRRWQARDTELAGTGSPDDCRSRWWEMAIAPHKDQTSRMYRGIPCRLQRQKQRVMTGGDGDADIEKNLELERRALTARTEPVSMYRSLVKLKPSADQIGNSLVTQGHHQPSEQNKQRRQRASSARRPAKLVNHLVYSNGTVHHLGQWTTGTIMNS